MLVGLIVLFSSCATGKRLAPTPTMEDLALRCDYSNNMRVNVNDLLECRAREVASNPVLKAKESFDKCLRDTPMVTDIENEPAWDAEYAVLAQNCRQQFYQEDGE